MSVRPSVPGRPRANAPSLDGAFTLVVAGAAALVLLVVLAAIRGTGGPGATAGASPTTGPQGAFLYPDPRPAPPLALTDEQGRPFDIAQLRGEAALIFFGYTHCPDVCPATMGIVTEVASTIGSDLRVVFVSIDPERDTVGWLAEYVRFLPEGFTALTGSAAEVRAAADAWGVRYARVDTGDPTAYSMSHTAEVYVVDAAGVLRAHFPFGTQAPAMIEALHPIIGRIPSAPQATPPATAAPTTSPAATSSPVGAVRVEVVSTSVWAGGSSPVILRLSGPSGPPQDPGAGVSVRVTDADGRNAGPPVAAVSVRQPGVHDISWVAIVDLASPGAWGLAVEVAGATSLAGWTAVTAMDPGATAPLGGPAPDVRTPTLDDVGGEALRVTTDPLPDLRLSRTSTVDALAASAPFVLVVDSIRFKVTPACGKALTLAKYLALRWPSTTFIHLEPYAYDVVTDSPVLRGTLEAPELVPAANAWGIGGSPWGAASMPWVFIVDGDGTVVAKYQGIVGSDDIDVILSMLVAR